MKLTATQLRKIIAEEVSRARMSEALDPAQLAESDESELFATVAQIAKSLEQTASQGQRAVDGAAKQRADMLPKVVAANLQNLKYSLEELTKVVDELEARAVG